MRVLLLHPEDELPAERAGRKWDWIVDLARAPLSTYERWSGQTGARVISLYDFAQGFEDLHRVRELLQPGIGQWVDASEIDWWDVVSLMIEGELRQLMLVGRLAQELPRECEIFTSRPNPVAAALPSFIETGPIDVARGFRPVTRWARHYRDAFSQLDAAQMSQVFQDKFDREHVVRRRLAPKRRTTGDPVVLLPSAYVNVSRSAASYAGLLPKQKFLLAYARNSARLKTLPSNVSTTSLDSYFVTADKMEARALAEAWESLKNRLVAGAQEYAAADATGVFDQVPDLMRWGIAVRDAWNQLLDSETVAGCLCADDSNPYTRIPLMLAKLRGIPTLVCHHGALDSKMAVKVAHADSYLAKGEIERDFLIRSCGVAVEKVVLGGQGLPSSPNLMRTTGQAIEPWLVFFTEPFQASGWRTDEVYRDLLPKLWSLAQGSGLKLVFKIHPFESVRGHRRMLRNFLPRQEAEIGVLAGAPSPQLWSNTRLALTVQSTVALQCASLGIPVFLCSWLRDPNSGYVEQFSRFGVGHIIESAGELSQIPGLLARQSNTIQMRPALWETMDAAKLRRLLLRTSSFSEAIKA